VRCSYSSARRASRRWSNETLPPSPAVLRPNTPPRRRTGFDTHPDREPFPVLDQPASLTGQPAVGAGTTADGDYHAARTTSLSRPRSSSTGNRGWEARIGSFSDRRRVRARSRVPFHDREPSGQHCPLRSDGSPSGPVHRRVRARPAARLEQGVQACPHRRPASGISRTSSTRHERSPAPSRAASAAGRCSPGLVPGIQAVRNT